MMNLVHLIFCLLQIDLKVFLYCIMLFICTNFSILFFLSLMEVQVNDLRSISFPKLCLTNLHPINFDMLGFYFLSQIFGKELVSQIYKK
jgi:hypothetical protein